MRGGTLRAIAHTDKARLPDFPDIPTFKELGYDMVATLWFALSGPANLPKDDHREGQRRDQPRRRNCPRPRRGCGGTA